MTPNASFALLDSAVISGRAEDLVVSGPEPWTHARLLEEVAALGGVLRHLGVGVGVTVPVQLGEEHPVEAVVAALAVARLGAVVTTASDAAAPVVVTSVTSAGPEGPAGPEGSSGSSGSSGGDGPSASGEQVRLVRAPAGEQAREPDLDWSVMLRAGRTDPAAAAVLDPASAYSSDRTLAEQLDVLAAARAPYDAAELRRLLQV